MAVFEVSMDLKHINIWPMTRLWRFQNLRKEAWKWHQRNQAPRNLDKSNKLHLLHKILKILPCTTSKMTTFAMNVERNLCFKDISSKSLFLSCLLKHLPKISLFFCSAYLCCTKCRYSSCCSRALSIHVQLFHGPKTPQFTLGHPSMLPNEVFCVCGFSTKSGNKMGMSGLKSTDLKQNTYNYLLFF